MAASRAPLPAPYRFDDPRLDERLDRPRERDPRELPPRELPPRELPRELLLRDRADVLPRPLARPLELLREVNRPLADRCLEPPRPCPP
jgi:hypothetical protein